MKRLIQIIGILVVLLILIAVALPFLVNANAFRPKLESELTQALGRRVSIGNLKFAILSGSITADNLSVADDPAFSSSPFLRAKALSLNVELWPLISSRKLNIQGLTINAPDIALIQSPAGTWNFSSIGGKSTAASKTQTVPVSTQPSQSSGLDLSAKLVRVTEGRLSMSELNSRAKPQVLDNVNAEVKDFSPAARFPFTLTSKVASGGDIALQGTAGPIDATDAASTPVEVNLKVTSLNLAGSGFVDPSSGIDGLVSIDGNGSSNGQLLQWKGAVRMDKAKLARGGTPARKPIQFAFGIQHDLRKHAGTLSRGQIMFGKAAAGLTGNYVQRGESTALNMHLAGSGMPVPELTELLPPLDIVLPAGSSLAGGTAKIDLTVTGPTNALVSDGSMALNNTTLAGFNLGGRLSAVAKLAGVKESPNTEIQTLSAAFHATPQSTEIRQMQLIVPAIGNLDGTGTISAAHALDLKMKATVHSSAILASVGQRNDTVVPFFVQGTASNPVFKPDVQGIAASEINRLTKGNLGKGNVGKTATDILGGFLGGKKK
jgi:AsmA protein